MDKKKDWLMTVQYEFGRADLRRITNGLPGATGVDTAGEGADSLLLTPETWTPEASAFDGPVMKLDYPKGASPYSNKDFDPEIYIRKSPDEFFDDYQDAYDALTTSPAVINRDLALFKYFLKIFKTSECRRIIGNTLELLECLPEKEREEFLSTASDLLKHYTGMPLADCLEEAGSYAFFYALLKANGKREVSQLRFHEVSRLEKVLKNSMENLEALGAELQAFSEDGNREIPPDVDFLADFAADRGFPPGLAREELKRSFDEAVFEVLQSAPEKAAGAMSDPELYEKAFERYSHMAERRDDV